MKIEIFEINFGDGGDLYFVTRRCNQIIIPDGENLFERWCDQHNIIENMWWFPRHDKELLKEFALLNRHKWQIEYDANGEYYGNAEEFVDAYTGSITPVCPC